MIDLESSVREFHKMTGIPTGKRPCNLSLDAFSRRVRLISEELSEYCEAVSNNNIPEIADALADLVYVVIGAAVEHGIPFNYVFDLVHKSNMTKTDGHKDESGKWIKPDSFEPVDLNFLYSLESVG